MRRALRSLSLLALIVVVGTASIAVASELGAFDAVRTAVTGEPSATTHPPEPAPDPPDLQGTRQAPAVGGGGPADSSRSWEPTPRLKRTRMRSWT